MPSVSRMEPPASRHDVDAERMRAMRLHVKRAPRIRVPFGPLCWGSFKWLPEPVLGPRAWKQLVAYCSPYAVTPLHLKDLFLRLCDPEDASLGTVPLASVVALLPPQYSQLLERLLRRPRPAPRLTSSAVKRSRRNNSIRGAADTASTNGAGVAPFSTRPVGGGAGEHDRIRFEDLAMFVVDLCSLPVPALALAAAGALRDFPALTATTIRAVVRFAHARYDATAGADQPGLSALAKLALGHLQPDSSGLSPFHGPDALAHLCVRYPSLIQGVLRLQRAVQREFFGRRLWRAYHKSVGTDLLPPDFTAEAADAVTARVVMLESVSLSTAPFVFGSAATSVEPPLEALQLVPHPSAGGGASGRPNSPGSGRLDLARALARDSGESSSERDSRSTGGTESRGSRGDGGRATGTGDGGLAIEFDADLTDTIEAARAKALSWWTRVKGRSGRAAKSARSVALSRMHSIRQAVGLSRRPDAAFKARVEAALAAESAGHKAAEARIGVSDPALLAGELPARKPTFLGGTASGGSTAAYDDTGAAVPGEGVESRATTTNGGARRQAVASQLRVADQLASAQEGALARWRQAQWDGHAALADDCLELLITMELEKVRALMDGEGEWGREEEERRRAEEDAKKARQQELRLGTVTVAGTTSADGAYAGATGDASELVANKRRLSEVVGGFGLQTAAEAVRREEVARQEQTQFLRQRRKEVLLRDTGQGSTRLALHDDDDNDKDEHIAHRESPGRLMTGGSAGGGGCGGVPLLGDDGRRRNLLCDGLLPGTLGGAGCGAAATTTSLPGSSSAAAVARSAEPVDAVALTGVDSRDSAGVSRTDSDGAGKSEDQDGDDEEDEFALMPAEMRREMQAAARRASAAEAALAHFQQRAVDNRSVVERLLNPVDKTLPMPLPQVRPAYLAAHPHPHGAACELTSLQIALKVLAFTTSGAGASFSIVDAPCLYCGRSVTGAEGSKETANAAAEPAARTSDPLPVDGDPTASGVPVTTGQRPETATGPPSVATSLAPATATATAGLSAREFAGLSAADDAQSTAGAVEATVATNATYARHSTEERAAVATFLPSSGRLRHASDNHCALQDRLEKAAARRREIERRMQMAREIAETRRRAVSRDAARRNYDRGSTRALPLTGADAALGADSASPPAETVGGSVRRLHAPTAELTLPPAAATIDDDELEDAAVREIAAELGRLPPPATGALADDASDGALAAATACADAEEMALARASASRATPPTDELALVDGNIQLEATTPMPARAAAFSMHGFEPRAPDASIRGRTAQLREGKSSNTGFCAECDAHIYGLLRELYGYKLADAVLDAATVKPAATDVAEMHSKAAAKEGHPLAPTLPPGLDESDVPRVVAEQGCGLEQPGDLFVEVLDEGSRRMFYYNVLSGESQWAKPAVYKPFKDRPLPVPSGTN